MKIYRSDLDVGPVWVDDHGPMPAAAEAAAKRPRRLRAWQRFVMCYGLILAGGLLTAPAWGSTWPSGGPWQLFAVIGLLVWLAAGLVFLTIASIKGRL